MKGLSRLILFLMLFKLVTACKSLKRMLPEGPAIKTEQRAQFEAKPPHQVVYTAAPKVDFPVNPLQVWAATYELDIIIVSKHPQWNMHEYAKLETTDGDLWIMKDAEEGSLDQFITADLDSIHTWLPELPVARKSYPVEVEDRSAGKWLDFTFRYNNIKGQQIEATYKGKRPQTPLKKRNGSTMGHSSNQLLVALDLPYRDFGKRATISYDSVSYKIDKLLGLVPFQMALTQTQGGASKGKYTLSSNNEELRSSHQTQATAVEQQWSVRKKDNKTYLEQSNDFRTTTYVFEGTDTLLLSKAYVQQWNKTKQGVTFSFYPPLPDVRRPFEGKFTSSFVIDVAGQHNHAVGEATAYWEKEQFVLEINPTAPWWVTDRPMKTNIDFTLDKVTVDIKMLPLDD